MSLVLGELSVLTHHHFNSPLKKHEEEADDTGFSLKLTQVK